MTYVQVLQEDYTNKEGVSAPAYQVNDRVFVDAQNFCSKQPFQKLGFKSYGPYLMVKIISPYAYQLSPPPESNTHTVFYINKLWLSSNDPLPRQNPGAPFSPRVRDITKEWEYEGEKILDSRLFGR